MSKQEWKLTAEENFVYELNEFGSNKWFACVQAAGKGCATDEEKRQVGRLIAAAPDLLQALDELVKECIDEGWEVEAPDSGCAFNQAIQLIAAAKGVE